eukprot:6210463-Pleurochrysis_carterae.AAC.1
MAREMVHGYSVGSERDRLPMSARSQGYRLKAECLTTNCGNRAGGSCAVDRWNGVSGLISGNWKSCKTSRRGLLGCAPRKQIHLRALREAYDDDVLPHEYDERQECVIGPAMRRHAEY